MQDGVSRWLTYGGFTLPTFGAFPKCEAEKIALHWSYHFGLGSTDFQT